MQNEIRVGLGHDTHRLSPGGPLRLGGIDVEYDHHLVGHSDADVLLHAITDSLLGAAALGDIGELFPDDRPENHQRDSAEMLSAAYRRVTGAGWQLINIDCVVLAQKPKLLPHRPDIQRRIAEILSTQPERIGLKAKTGETVGEVGEGRIIQAICTSLIGRSTGS